MVRFPSLRPSLEAVGGGIWVVGEIHEIHDGVPRHGGEEEGAPEEDDEERADEESSNGSDLAALRVRVRARA